SLGLGLANVLQERQDMVRDELETGAGSHAGFDDSKAKWARKDGLQTHGWRCLDSGSLEEYFRFVRS
ncbi:hypothetical protein G3M48_002256, partial [Beauveria asiatica]